jgi:hypothetical protein
MPENPKSKDVILVLLCHFVGIVLILFGALSGNIYWYCFIILGALLILLGIILQYIVGNYLAVYSWE